MPRGAFLLKRGFIAFWAALLRPQGRFPRTQIRFFSVSRLNRCTKLPPKVTWIWAPKVKDVRCSRLRSMVGRISCFLGYCLYQ